MLLIMFPPKLIVLNFLNDFGSISETYFFEFSKIAKLEDLFKGKTASPTKSSAFIDSHGKS